MNILIRIANIKDEDKIIDCIKCSYEKYIKRMGKKPAPMLDEYKSKIRSKYVHVVDKGNRIIGVIVLIPKKDHFYLGNLAVHPSEQRKGVGRQLMNYAEKLAVSSGFSAIHLFTNELVHETISIYRKYGYLEIDRKTENGYNRVYFVKHLNAEPKNGADWNQERR